ncbi:CRISPR-associated endonuclease Cas2 [Venenivibrio stagnispumantis]|uniref:CRISPR-associated endoribonuclease Cas2 n=1 Tax=Venenivibrio stagnispumantis TaxID=407998 RepID=A0AA45WJN6_9AQUI|nr:CRISPR-associated endonuclease Cas2 [Venenivibrio stagnispumantis]MCW4572900.1 CRISPR-associated endonuclease Cas2 [Venenivibrio stagnispumantis]SMP04123.1 CRISPR-associated protein, Cas2 family [Venenivibrio stagnispumantis]
MFVILVYDANEKRVQKFHKICKKYLTWVQNSVFEGEISEANLRILIDELEEIMDIKEDSILIYKFRTKKYYDRETIGIPKPSHEDLFI